MKKFLISALTGLAIIVIPASAYACSYSISGKGDCTPDGHYVITWTVDNVHDKDLTITSSSNPNLVSVGRQFKAGSTPINQKVDGTKASDYTLTLYGNWSDSTTPQKQSKKVTSTVCIQPAVATPAPTTPALTPTALTPAPAVAAIQFVAPKGAVNAGSVGSDDKLVNTLGLSGSVAVLGLGIRRLIKIER